MNYTWELSDFDTLHFGYKCAKVTTIDPTDTNLSQTIQELSDEFLEKEIMYAIYRLPADQFNVIHALEKNKWLLVDGLIGLKVDLSKQNIPSISGSIRTVNENDTEPLKKLAGSVFKHTRFFNDPFIDKQKANELYATWVENSVLGKAADEVLVYEEGSQIAGFITIQNKGHIPLIGVDSNFQGKGIAKQLVMAALSKLKEKEIEEVEIETQLINTAALRAYQACGFKITNSFLTFRWANAD